MSEDVTKMSVDELLEYYAGNFLGQEQCWNQKQYDGHGQEMNRVREELNRRVQKKSWWRAWLPR